MPTIHATAIIDDGATVGPGTRVWHWTHVCANAQIGADCVLGQNVYVGPGVRVGARCKIQNNVSVYEGVDLEDDVFVGPSAVFTNVRNPRAHVSRRDAFERTIVRRGATIGANATILCGREIGSFSFVGAGAVVTADVVPHSLVVGTPARHRGWVCTCGERLGPELRCGACEVSYVEAATGLVRR